MEGKVKKTLTAKGIAKLFHTIDSQSCSASNGSVASQPPSSVFPIISFGNGSVYPLRVPTIHTDKRNKDWIAQTTISNKPNFAIKMLPLVTGSVKSCFHPLA